MQGRSDVTWCGIDQALKKGHRGLIRNSSLPRFLLAHRAVRHRLFAPPLSVSMILQWADARYRRAGHWPTCWSGGIVEVPGETWLAIDKALRAGRRRLAGGSSLGALLAKHRNLRNNTNVPKLDAKMILAWADAHQKRTGTWPTRLAGPICEAPGETWHAVDAAFVASGRGLAGYRSLAHFLAKKRHVRNLKDLPDLTVDQILAWAREFQRRTGRLPTHLSGSIPNSAGETWGGVNAALYHGRRGLRKSSLYRLLSKLRPSPNRSPG